MAVEKSQKSPEDPSPVALEIAEKIVPGHDRPPSKPLEERHFHPREIKQNEWLVHLDQTVTVNDLLEKKFWGTVALKLRRGDKIVCMSEDGRLYVELVVFGCGMNWAEVRVFGEPIVVPRAVAAGGPASDYEVRYLGLIKEWGVVDSTTGRVVKGDGSLKTEDAARAWLAEFVRMDSRRIA
jgi:hypothetical protein